MAYARRERTVGRRVEEASEDGRDRASGTEAPAVEAVLRLQRVHGNHAVQRMLARTRTDFAFGSGVAEATTIRTQAELDEAVDDEIDQQYGHQSLFLKNEVATSVGQWRDLLFEYMSEEYALEGLDRGNVLAAVKRAKDRHREPELLHLANLLVYGSKDGPPWSVENLKARMAEGGAYLEDDDDPALTAIFETEGSFARTKVEVGPGDLELSDEDDIVVVMDSHQQKHQRDQIPEFPPYEGEPGTKFAAGKDLAWHVANTVPVVRETVGTAIAEDHVAPGRDYSPPKRPIDGIIYDLTISYDEATGKYVGSYHCNPRLPE